MTLRIVGTVIRNLLALFLLIAMFSAAESAFENYVVAAIAIVLSTVHTYGTNLLRASTENIIHTVDQYIKMLELFDESTNQQKWEEYYGELGVELLKERDTQLIERNINVISSYLLWLFPLWILLSEILKLIQKFL